jgi:thiol:disulfide interchange protein
VIRRILGFALFAVVVWLVLRIALDILGTLVGLAITVLVLAGLGYACYVVLRLISPSTAAKVRDAISGRLANVA